MSRRGRLIAIVGASGVGKDSVMQALVSARPDLHLVQRAITRTAEAGGEVFEAVTPQAFRSRVAAGAFALSWQAHGLDYGIPRTVDAVLAAGHDALVNLSRDVLASAAARFPGMIVIQLTADPATLAARLAARGREAPADIARRLARADAALPDGITALVVDNSGPIEAAVTAILAHISSEKV
ncbi:phosphonate metabolism protein/1,5-bisphosphokinase (PRPP-forming) PhnN [Pseudooceanicola sp.]|uniref:phosphonate metabolism protein/1,5-bisphosphokinase (PRPP-forming) PhnN n=1 Tax=Pseudooceanicola sp. TaxID=1914328 RepID=UPI002639159E|nr:phosphonate metabolism protein/1,5-bisphosphokinase (PRPP-forming) PhnN [Pseudooceanicola sp.]MDF1855537.1 phosphonate metabolism protein/1,5-bisphosphokinase (PRPP-forming) PhnN [Pseudooceanicola sp.]